MLTWIMQRKLVATTMSQVRVLRVPAAAAAVLLLLERLIAAMVAAMQVPGMHVAVFQLLFGGLDKRK